MGDSVTRPIPPSRRNAGGVNPPCPQGLRNFFRTKPAGRHVMCTSSPASIIRTPDHVCYSWRTRVNGLLKDAGDLPGKSGKDLVQTFIPVITHSPHTDRRSWYHHCQGKDRHVRKNTARGKDGSIGTGQITHTHKSHLWSR